MDGPSRRPTEQCRREGTPSQSEVPSGGARAFCLLLRCSKVSRCKSETIRSHYRSNGYVHREQARSYSAPSEPHRPNPHHQHHRPRQQHPPPPPRRMPHLHKPIGNHPSLPHRHHQHPPTTAPQPRTPLCRHSTPPTQPNTPSSIATPSSPPHNTYTNGNNTTHTRSTMCQYNTPDSSPLWRPGA